MDKRLQQFRIAVAVFVVALLVHSGDHLRRGFGASTVHVNVIGNLQLVLAVTTVVLAFQRNWMARPLAIVVGFASAFGFIVVHIVPYWSAFSDSFTGTHHAHGVTGFSWFAALFEIAADIGIATAAWRLPSGRDGNRLAAGESIIKVDA